MAGDPLTSRHARNSTRHLQREHEGACHWLPQRLAAIGALYVIPMAVAGGLAGWIHDSTAPRWQSAAVILLVPLLLGLGVLLDPNPSVPAWYHAVTSILGLGAAGAAGAVTLSRLGR